MSVTNTQRDDARARLRELIDAKLKPHQHEIDAANAAALEQVKQLPAVAEWLAARKAADDLHAKYHKLDRDADSLREKAAEALDGCDSYSDERIYAGIREAADKLVTHPMLTWAKTTKASLGTALALANSATALKRFYAKAFETLGYEPTDLEKLALE